MNWGSVAGAVGKFAPLLGSALGGPAGGAVGSLVASVLGVEDTPSAVSAALADPDAAVKLQALQVKHKERLSEIALETTRIELQDKHSARVAHKHSPMPAVICCALTVLVGLGAWLLFTVEIPSDNREIAYLLFGTLLAKWGDSIAYWVGTTRSSAEKDRRPR